MQEATKKRNGLIDVIRFVFAGIIVMFHFYNGGEKHFFGGKFGVEFFCILSGFLFYMAWDRKQIAIQGYHEKVDYWKNYMKKRYLRFFWYSLVAFLVTFLVVRVWHDGIDSAFMLSDKLSGDIWEILMTKMNGFNRGKGLLNGPAWTLGCMLFAEFFILGMLVHWERPFLTFWMPCSLIMGCGYWINIKVANHTIFLGLFTFGMLRVYLLTCFGILSYYLCKKIQSVKFTDTGRLLLTGCEWMGYAWCILVACFKSTRNYQFCFIAVMTITVALSFSGATETSKIVSSNRFTSFLGEYSLCIYLTHRAVQRYYQYTYLDINDLYRQKFTFLAAVFVVGLVYLLFMRYFLKALPRVGRFLKSKLVMEPGCARMK